MGSLSFTSQQAPLVTESELRALKTPIPMVPTITGIKGILTGSLAAKLGEGGSLPTTL